MSCPQRPAVPRQVVRGSRRTRRVVPPTGRARSLGVQPREGGGSCKPAALRTTVGCSRQRAPRGPHQKLGEAGVEPARPFGQEILNLQRLPFRHSPKWLGHRTLNEPAIDLNTIAGVHSSAPDRLGLLTASIRFLACRKASGTCRGSASRRCRLYSKHSGLSRASCKRSLSTVSR
jgi:hypothetical protein